MLNEIPTDPLMKGLTKAWLMQPHSNSSMRLGAMNEGNVLLRVGQFFNANVGHTLPEGCSCEWVH